MSGTNFSSSLILVKKMKSWFIFVWLIISVMAGKKVGIDDAWLEYLDCFEKRVSVMTNVCNLDGTMIPALQLARRSLRLLGAKGLENS